MPTTFPTYQLTLTLKTQAYEHHKAEYHVAASSIPEQCWSDRLISRRHLPGALVYGMPVAQYCMLAFTRSTPNQK